MSFPPISKGLLDYLQHVFPDKLPMEPITPERMGVLIGQQMVLRHLKHLFAKQGDSLPKDL